MERFHFAVEFEADADPEFPGDGEWGCAVYGFNRQGAVVEDFGSAWGTPLVVKVELSGGRAGLGCLRRVAWVESPACLRPPMRLGCV